MQLQGALHDLLIHPESTTQCKLVVRTHERRSECSTFTKGHSVCAMRPHVLHSVLQPCSRQEEGHTAQTRAIHWNLVLERWNLCTWLEHIHRHTAQPCLDLLQCQNSQWLAARRSDHGGSQTRTRQHPGIPMRWDSGWVQTVADVVGDMRNQDKVKEKTQLKADTLYQAVF